MLGRREHRGHWRAIGRFDRVHAVLGRCPEDVFGMVDRDESVVEEQCVLLCGYTTAGKNDPSGKGEGEGEGEGEGQGQSRGSE